MTPFRDNNSLDIHLLSSDLVLLLMTTSLYMQINTYPNHSGLVEQVVFFPTASPRMRKPTATYTALVLSTVSLSATMARLTHASDRAART